MRKLLFAFALLFVGATGLLYYVATPSWFTALPQQWMGLDLIGKTPEEVHSVLGEPTGSELSVKMLEEWAISDEPTGRCVSITRPFHLVSIARGLKGLCPPEGYRHRESIEGSASWNATNTDR
ncbi:hypothetical protein K1W69_13760 [Hoeflea sp. WL0058]|uniref:Uncharacterized protein n=1 Tax=Flavimaribacter sediminis TaxID=2865987 RepID=A0AAE3D1T1_9HYPH|nr:hypothetical protein [Flavimaribacter sediminis]MBW8638257.1 hypothetical protein [Flavimaribacter sediminis]